MILVHRDTAAAGALLPHVGSLFVCVRVTFDQMTNDTYELSDGGSSGSTSALSL